MLPLDHASALLANAGTLDGLRALAGALGFPSHAVGLPDALRRRLVDDAALDTARLLLGDDPLAALVAIAPETPDLRPLVRAVATTLARHTPHRRWLLLIATPTGRTVLATWSEAPPQVRVAALAVDRDLLRPSDIDTLRLLAAARDRDPLRTHDRWLDTLRRGTLGDRFYRAVADTLDDLAASAVPAGLSRVALPVRRELALLTTSRLLFLAFLEAKGWLDHDRQFLRRHLERTLADGGHLQRRLLDPLCFGTLNTPTRQRAAAARQFGMVPFLNGGLFTRTPLEKLHRLTFADGPLCALIADVLGGFRFTAHESAPHWHDAAIDPTMLGRTFESLMAHDERRRFGTFFTPPALVDEMLDRALRVLDEHPPAHRTRHITVLDPACGSGAFLVRALERLADRLADAGDERPVDQRRRDVLTHSIFGIDRHPLAIWLCELRLWLSVVIDATTAAADVPPLPNLDHHLHVGDALTGGDFAHATPLGSHLSTLRTRYTRATGARKRTLARTLDRAERDQARHALDHAVQTLSHHRREQLAALRTRDLFGDRPRPAPADTRLRLDRRTRLRELRALRRALDRGAALPFRADAHFADIAARGGFDLVIGNPPWVRPHHVDQSTRTILRRDFAVARTSEPSPHFGLQVDLASCFTERALALLAPGGALALLLPAKLWRSLAGGPLRAHLQHHSTLRAIHDLSDGPAIFHAATYPSVLVAQRPTGDDDPNRRTITIDASVATRTARPHFTIHPNALPLDPRRTAPWLIVPPSVRRAVDALRLAGVPLGEQFGTPKLGVKCGVNAAFLVSIVAACGERTRITDGTREAWIESALLRPVLRGEHLTTGRLDPRAAIIYPHHDDGTPIHPLPPLTSRWFAPHRTALAARTDARHARHWYTLARLDGARTTLPRITWNDIGRRLHARLLPSGAPHVPLNSCYILHTPHPDDALALLAVLHAPLTSALLSLLAEPARGGYRRFLGHTVAQLPLPNRDRWLHYRDELRTAGAALHAHHPVDPDTLDELAGTALGAARHHLHTVRQWVAHR